MKDVLSVIGVMVAVFSIAIAGYKYTASDTYIRNRVFLLKSEKGACSGVQVRGTRSHDVYILTAGHCRDILVDNSVTATDEQGNTKSVSFVAEDVDADLMLLTAANSKSVDLATRITAHEHLHSLTHGHAYPTYRTDGEYLTQEVTIIGVRMIESDLDRQQCTVMPKYKIVMSLFGDICTMQTLQTIASVAVVPGSSGGPLLDDSGRLVGIVSAGNPSNLNTFVTLSDIKAFLNNK